MPLGRRRWGSRPLAGLGALVLAASVLTAGFVAGPAAASRSPGQLRVGSVTLLPCPKAAHVWCGSIKAPLDYALPGSSTITIGFQWLPAEARATGTVLAVEGGPGYSSTGSRYLYAPMLGRLRASRNLLLVNLRGTGNSTLLDCPRLQSGRGPQSGPVLARVVGACGAQLDHRWRAPDGSWLHAADLFNTANSARDTARVVAALGLSRLDLYGDSYGTWFAQTFASRYPGLLRSVTLDSTYQVLRLSPWYTSTVVRAREAFNTVCRRQPACAHAAPGSSWARISALAVRLRRSPVSGMTTGLNGRPEHVRVGIQALVDLVNNAGFDPIVYQDLDAAARAVLDDNDPAPLLRLYALSYAYDDLDASLPDFSDDLYVAVSCTDYPQLFSMHARPSVRARQYARALARRPAGTFAPFSAREWTLMDYTIETYNACLDWPSPVHRDPPIVIRPPLVPRTLPVLILSGSLDSLTPTAGARLVRRQLGPSARVVLLPNLTHVTAEGDIFDCGSAIFRQFVADPSDLFHLNTSCSRTIPEIHTVAAYPSHLADAIPAIAGAGDTAGTRALQAASVAVAAVGDEIARRPYLFHSVDSGLRGGSVQFVSGHGAGMTIRLHGVRYVDDATVDGTALWSAADDTVLAHLTVRGPGHLFVYLAARWSPYQKLGQALVTGRAGHARLVATLPAP